MQGRQQRGDFLLRGRFQVRVHRQAEDPPRAILADGEKAGTTRVLLPGKAGTTPYFPSRKKEGTAPDYFAAAPRRPFKQGIGRSDGCAAGRVCGFAAVAEA